jgi:hypothetical protein
VEPTPLRDFIESTATPLGDRPGLWGRLLNIALLALPTGPSIIVGLFVSPWGWVGLFLALFIFAVIAGVRLEREKAKREQVVLSIETEPELSKHWVQEMPPKKYLRVMDKIYKKSSKKSVSVASTPWYCRTKLLRVTNTSTVEAARRVRIQVQTVIPRNMPKKFLKAIVPKEIVDEPMVWEPLPIDLKWWHTKKKMCDIPPGGTAYAVIARHWQSSAGEAHDVILHLGRGMFIVAWCEGFAPTRQAFAFDDLMAEIKQREAREAAGDIGQPEDETKVE